MWGTNYLSILYCRYVDVWGVYVRFATLTVVAEAGGQEDPNVQSEGCRQQSAGCERCLLWQSLNS